MRHVFLLTSVMIVLCAPMTTTHGSSSSMVARERCKEVTALLNARAVGSSEREADFVCVDNLRSVAFWNCVAENVNAGAKEHAAFGRCEIVDPIPGQRSP